ncbi:MAG TPA: TIGR03619 family F420-dependent LLM class oxidoreductase [Candidatus Bathyarchaeia archaeon]|nr:TIGR03619 family F420-dependent LLM class oxidoreductase [Candidatus Bathyarchaeia archaeon]
MSRSSNRGRDHRISIGIALPQYGTIASPEAITHVALEGEKMGLASLWVSDRLLLPTSPRDTWDGKPWPEMFTTVYDPIEMLTWVAAKTKTIKLGTSVLSSLFQNPVTLARRFATLDRLSGGRVIAGLGQGDFKDEFTAAGIPHSRRGRGFGEFVEAVRACWGPDPVRYSGLFYHIPKSKIGPKPVQPGGIPLLIGAFEPKALERAARIGDGIMPSSGKRTTLEKLGQNVDAFRNMVRSAGRNPDETTIILNAHPTISETKAAEPRGILNGTPEQVASDLPGIEKLGIHHIFFDLNYPAAIPIETQLSLLRKLMKLISN